MKFDKEQLNYDLRQARDDRSKACENLDIGAKEPNSKAWKKYEDANNLFQKLLKTRTAIHHIELALPYLIED